MTFTAFVFIFASCAAMMALWIDVRFPKLGPEDLRDAMIRLGVAFVVVHVAAALSDFLIRPLGAPADLWVLLSVAFAFLTLTMLTTIWVLKVARGMMGGSLR